ncbi:unnamed protein product [Soboliphyme baturini]|uniref:B box-type domain-containing protein n=1 Tax=Soboliphyme baturini TaxID=241478 RepID=A0A183IJ40_9BILA|nr:unnamed protein product [Soboliphyme baturini]
MAATGSATVTAEDPPSNFDMNQFLRNTLSSFVLPVTERASEALTAVGASSPPTTRTMSSTKSVPNFLSSVVAQDDCAYCSQLQPVADQLYCQQCTNLFSNMPERAANHHLLKKRGDSSASHRLLTTSFINPTMCHVAVQTCADVNDGMLLVF